jgi:hypothetical protein
MFLVLMGADSIPPGNQYRAVTLDPQERRVFKVENIERVTGSSGRCIEEGLDSDTVDVLFLQAQCEGLRTAMVTRKDGSRIHLMACAEDEKRSTSLLKKRLEIQKMFKKMNAVTPCIRNGKIELWGWVRDAKELAAVAALETKYGLEVVKSFVEVIGAAE